MMTRSPGRTAGKGSPHLLLRLILHPPVTTRLPCPAASVIRPRPARGMADEGGSALHLSAGQRSGTVANGRVRLPMSLAGLVAPSALLFVPWHGCWIRGCGGRVGYRRPCSTSRPFATGLDASALPGTVCGIQRRGLVAQGRCPQDVGEGVLRSARYRRGRMRTQRPAASSRRRSSPSRLRAGGHESAAAQGPSGRPRRAGSRPRAQPPPHRVSNAAGRSSRPSSSLVGPPPSRESSCPTTGGALVAPAACPEGDAATAGATAIARAMYSGWSPFASCLALRMTAAISSSLRPASDSQQAMAKS